jgi:hypothetical protein
VPGKAGATRYSRLKGTMMSIKLKALGLSLLAVLAASAFAVMNASAESQPTAHFTSGSHNTQVLVFENPTSGTHALELSQPGFTGIVCHEPSYAVTNIGTTADHITVKPTYKKCTTTGGNPGSVTVHPNGCEFTFTTPNKESAKTEHTVTLNCPTGKSIQITHATCTVSIHHVEVKGVGYTTTVESAPGTIGGPKHSITLTVNVAFPQTRHGGFCSLLATNATGTLSGSATVFGKDPLSNNQIDITATGSIN